MVFLFVSKIDGGYLPEKTTTCTHSEGNLHSVVVEIFYFLGYKVLGIDLSNVNVKCDMTTTW